MNSLYSHSIVVIAPAALWPTVIAVNQALGYKPGPGVPLSADGSQPATHRGLHTWATTDFAAISTGQSQADVPGFTSQEIADFLASITVSVDHDGLANREHFDNIINGMGLVIVQPIED